MDGYNHYEIQKLYENLGEEKFIEYIQNDQNATEYLKNDVLSLRELFLKFNTEVEIFFKQIGTSAKLVDIPTIGSFAV